MWEGFLSSEEAYALYYDLLYSHRDVARETDFLERVFSQCSQVSVKKVLDVGCGTGIHSIELAKRGYEVLGVDLSHKMIEWRGRRVEPPVFLGFTSSRPTRPS